MNRILFLLFFVLVHNLSAQKVASYYFENNLDEFTGQYIPLLLTGEQGKFVNEVVDKFGSTPRKVYNFPEDAGLVFDNSKLSDFIKDSYTIEMFFRYDNGSLLLYNQLLGDKLDESQGKYVHLVMTRNAISKQVIVYLNGELQLQFVDTEDQLEMAADRQIIFFAQEGVKTTSGAVSMIKIYNYFIDEKDAESSFDNFRNNEQSKVDNLKTGDKVTLNKLYFIQSLPKLLPESFPELENLKSMLQENPDLKIEIQGHTDNQGDYQLNIELSNKRAESVKAYLVEYGIDKNRILTRGFGSTRPVASNATEITRKLNRRVEMVVL